MSLFTSEFQANLKELIVEAVEAAGGRAKVSQIDQYVENKLRDQALLTEEEWGEWNGPASGQNSGPKGRYRLRWIRKELKDPDGLLLNPSPGSGWWQLPEGSALQAVADRLLIDLKVLEDIVALLKDKGQVVLYGPPGTGKTYLARHLAKALSPSPDDQVFVQFHPSTSYEDFFEGYRPYKEVDGQISFRLTSGPLMRFVEHISVCGGQTHVMVIDEINRANLPKVLGELLFLLEYRRETISTLYRPDEEFGLPQSLWFIGTMNTVDRSIALVDAALRRRFHFVPFFPDRGPTEGLLGRWLEREDQPSWVGELVAKVNVELTKALGADLQLGASHFMKKGYGTEPSADDPVFRMIWQYNIEPFIEDQFFGNETQISKFRLRHVLERHGPSVGLDDGLAEQT